MTKDTASFLFDKGLVDVKGMREAEQCHWTHFCGGPLHGVTKTKQRTVPYAF